MLHAEQASITGQLTTTVGQSIKVDRRGASSDNSLLLSWLISGNNSSIFLFSSSSLRFEALIFSNDACNQSKIENMLMIMFLVR